MRSYLEASPAIFAVLLLLAVLICVTWHMIQIRRHMLQFICSSRQNQCAQTYRPASVHLTRTHQELSAASFRQEGLSVFANATAIQSLKQQFIISARKHECDVCIHTFAEMTMRVTVVTQSIGCWLRIVFRGR